MNSSKRWHASICLVASMLALVLLLPPVTQAFFKVTIYFGKGGRTCEGFGLCRIVIEPGKNVDATAARRRILEGKAGEASMSLVENAAARMSGTSMRIEMSTTVPDKAASLPVETDLVLDAETSKALGFRSVTVLRGDYKVDYTKNKSGTVIVNVRAEGRE